MTWRLYADNYRGDDGLRIVTANYTDPNDVPYEAKLRVVQHGQDVFFRCPCCGKPTRVLNVRVRGLLCGECQRRQR